MQNNLKLLFAFLLVVGMVNAHAQKLPNKQDVSLRAPVNINIDGKATEWDNKYQAFNKAVEIYYSIANDDDNLYLIIHAVKSSIIEKMMEGGISFSVNSLINKKEKATILFPLIPIQDCRKILHTAGKSLSEGAMSRDPESSYVNYSSSSKQLSINEGNTLLSEKSKEIKVSGMKTIIDTIPGVNPKTRYYDLLPLRFHEFQIVWLKNHDNINAATCFDKDGNYTYELSVPLKLVGLSADQQKFIYNIVINGRGEDHRIGNTFWYDRRSKPERKLYQDMETPTDFSGEYTLAKKP